MSDKSKFFDCSSYDDLCSLDEAPIADCANGAGTALVEFGVALKNLPQGIWQSIVNTPAQISNCIEDDNFKKKILGPLRPVTMTDEAIRRMTCAEARSFVNTKMEVVINRINAKILDLKTKYKSDDRIPYSELNLSEVEKNVLAYDFSQPAAFRQASCYKRSEKIKFFCATATQMAATFVTGKAVAAVLPVAISSIASGTRMATRSIAGVTESLSNRLPKFFQSELKSGPIQLPKEIQNKFPELKAAREVELENGEVMVRYSFKDAAGKEVGELDGFMVNENTLAIGFFRIFENYRRSGLLNFLFQQLIKDLPQTTRISIGTLSSMNEAVYKNALKKGLSPEQAIKETPAFKAQQKLGFSEIVPGSINPETGRFLVQRPGVVSTAPTIDVVLPESIIGGGESNGPL